MERSINATKRKLIEKEAQVQIAAETDVKDILQKDYDKLSYRMTQQNKAYNDFCKANDLQPQYDRIKVADFGREQTKRSNAWARRYRSENLLKNSAGKDIIKVNQTKTTADSNSITQKTNAKGGIDRNFYDNDGRQIAQISNNGHGHKKEEALGKHGEHAHDYIWDKDGNITRSEARELTDQERRDNDDFL